MWAHKRRIMSLVVAVFLVLSLTATAFAAAYDVTDKTTGVAHGLWDYTENRSLQFDIGENPGNYTIEVGEKQYELNDVIEVMVADEDITVDDAVVGLVPVDEEEEELEVVSVSAINAKTLEVTFNQAVAEEDQADVTFDVKRGTIATTVEATWAEDGMSVELARATNLLAGTYTVTVEGLEFAEGANVGTVEVEAQKAVSIEIETNRIEDAASQALEYVVKDQYDEEMTVAPASLTVLAYNVTKSKNIGAVTPINNFDISTDTDNGDVVRFTAYLTADPDVKVIKEVTVANINLASIEFGNPVLPEDATRFVPGLTDVVIPVTAVDDAGEAIELSYANIGAFTADTELDWSFTNISAAKTEKGDLVVTLDGANTQAKPATVTVVNPVTGDVVTVTIDVELAAMVNTVEFGEATIIAGDAATYQLPVTFIDQYGNIVPDTDVSVQNKQLDANLNFNVAVAGTGTLNISGTSTTSADGKYITFTNATEGTYTLTLTNKTTGAQSTTTIEVLEGRLPNELKVKTAPDATVGETGSTNVEFEVIDQYGEDVTFANMGTAGYKIIFDTTDATVLDITDTTNDIDTSDNSLKKYDPTLNGVGEGEATVTFELTDGTDVVDSQAFEIEVVADLSAFDVSVDKDEYNAGDTVAVTIKAQKDDGTGTDVLHADYNKTGVAEVTIGSETYFRTVTFVKGVATTTVPAEEANAAETVTVAFDGQTDLSGTFEVKALEATKLAVDVSNKVYVADKYGNKVTDYNFTGVANVTNVDGTLAGVTPNKEGQVQLVITAGDVFASDGTTNVTFNGADATLTLELANGDTFSVTVE